MLPIIEQSRSETSSTTALPTSETLITEWNIGQRTISLFYGTQNTLVAVDGRDGTRDPFRSTLYSIEYAANLIEMFHRTIQLNLEREGLNDYCFLPKLCIEAQNAPEMTVALFGDRDTSSNDEEEPRVLRWGVFNSSTREEYPVEANDPLSEIFIRHAPATDVPHMRPVLDENGQAIMKDGKAVMEPAFNHYAMTSYAKRFGVVIERDATDRIQNVVLHRVSLLDKNVLLDHHNWAVTLVSTKSSSQTQNILGRWLGEYAGHAMLACEGVEEDTPFLRYIHLTQNPRERIPNLAADEAQIESFDKSTPLDTVNAPTWVRSKDLVENMFSFVAGLENQPVKFALYGSFFDKESVIDKGHRIQFANHRRTSPFDTGFRVEYIEVSEEQIPHTCLEWTDLIAEKCGIISGRSIALRKPLDRIEEIRAGPVFTLPSNLASWEVQKGAWEQILSSRVFLTHPDCSPKEAKRWAEQWVIADGERESLKFSTPVINILQRVITPEQLGPILEATHSLGSWIYGDSPRRPEPRHTMRYMFFGIFEEHLRELAGTLHRNIMPLLTFEEVPRNEYRRPPRIPLDTIRSIFFGGPEHDEARRRYPLADEASKVKTLYEQLKLNPRIRCPEAAALSEYWKEEALQAEKAYDLCKTQDARNDLIGHRKIELGSEKVAKTLKLEHLFWKTLSNDSPLFEAIFLQHGVDAHRAISKFATWDSRNEEERFLAIFDRAANSNILLTFNNPDIRPISYSAILRNDLEGVLEEKLLEQAFIRALTEISETRQEAV